MTPDREKRIRARAYEIWEGEGRPEGKQAEHWERAARQIESEESGHSEAEVRQAGEPMDELRQEAASSAFSSGLQSGSSSTPGETPATGAGGKNTKGGSTGTPKRGKKQQGL